MWYIHDISLIKGQRKGQIRMLTAICVLVNDFSIFRIIVPLLLEGFTYTVVTQLRHNSYYNFVTNYNNNWIMGCGRAFHKGKLSFTSSWPCPFQTRWGRYYYNTCLSLSLHSVIRHLRILYYTFKHVFNSSFSVIKNNP